MNIVLKLNYFHWNVVVASNNIQGNFDLTKNWITNIKMSDLHQVDATYRVFSS